MLSGEEREAHAVGGVEPAEVWRPADLDALAAGLAEGAGPVVPYGGGQRLAQLPPEARVLRTEAFAGAIAHAPEDGVVTAGAGTPLMALNRALAPAGHWLPFESADAGRETLGGLFASGAVGPLRAGWGVGRDWALGCTFVDGAGRVVKPGGKVVKNVAGYDLTRLAWGAAGRLGVLTELSFRVFPRPGAWAVLGFSPASWAEARELAFALRQAPWPWAALYAEAREIQARPTFAAVLAGSPEAVAALAARAEAAWGPERVSRLNEPVFAAAWASARRRQAFRVQATVRLQDAPDAADAAARTGAASLAWDAHAGTLWAQFAHPLGAAGFAGAVEALGGHWRQGGPLPFLPRPWGPARDDEPLMRAVAAAFDPHGRLAR